MNGRKSPGANRGSILATHDHSTLAPTSSWAVAFIQASVLSQHERETEAPRRDPILAVIRRAFKGAELDGYDLDFDDPKIAEEYHRALIDVRGELGCDGRIVRSAAAILTLDRIRGRAPR